MIIFYNFINKFQFDNFNDFIRDENNKDYFKGIITKFNQGLDQYSQFRISETEEKS